MLSIILIWSFSYLQLPSIIHNTEKGYMLAVIFIMASIGFAISFVSLLLIAIYEDELNQIVHWWMVWAYDWKMVQNHWCVICIYSIWTVHLYEISSLWSGGALLKLMSSSARGTACNSIQLCDADMKPALKCVVWRSKLFYLLQHNLFPSRDVLWPLHHYCISSASPLHIAFDTEITHWSRMRSAVVHIILP